jgi:hypothetical protein
MRVPVTEFSPDGPHVSDADVGYQAFGFREDRTFLADEGRGLKGPVGHEGANPQAGPLLVSNLSQDIQLPKADDPPGPGDALLDDDHQGNPSRHDGDVAPLPVHEFEGLFERFRF